MYLATSAGVFYTFDMSLLPVNSGPATGPAVVIKTGNPSLQLSFSCDFSVLWAQNYENNQWSTVNTGAVEGAREREGKRKREKKRKEKKNSHHFPLHFSPSSINSHGRRHPEIHAAHPRAAQGPARPGRRCVHLRVISAFCYFYDLLLLLTFYSLFSTFPFFQKSHAIQSAPYNLQPKLMKKTHPPPCSFRLLRKKGRAHLAAASLLVWRKKREEGKEGGTRFHSS